MIVFSLHTKRTPQKGIKANWMKGDCVFFIFWMCLRFVRFYFSSFRACSFLFFLVAAEQFQFRSVEWMRLTKRKDQREILMNRTTLTAALPLVSFGKQNKRKRTLNARFVSVWKDILRMTWSVKIGLYWHSFRFVLWHFHSFKRRKFDCNKSAHGNFNSIFSYFEIENKKS